MQPHRYSRLSNLFDGFCTCFNDADTVFITEVYAAGEKPIEGATRDHLVEGMARHGHHDVRKLERREDLARVVFDTAKEGDIVVCMGAGDITYWAYALPDELTALQKNAKGNAA